MRKMAGPPAPAMYSNEWSSEMSGRYTGGEYGGGGEYGAENSAFQFASVWTRWLFSMSRMSSSAK